ncbi:hypothetical protein LNKW23_26840 [Paralimibaculum aggregatum]|uniref:AlgX/AlgJ SGNH hydrolase-like domain-containing protein n=1 Tax=Paralimibaculum aggregatum TaxID=3036245 RepID=A0ABQ6LM04_9RHOB|nr:hypothetical protein [Limibaculum sp. NKW23]GMG83471.1 hypothetical protein LNKW23_26840 [Limibaculum sp. NKW23]
MAPRPAPLRATAAVRRAGLLVALLLAAPVAIGLLTTEPERRSRQLKRVLAPLPAAADWAGNPHAALGGLADFAADRIAGLLAASRGLAMLRHEVFADPAALNVVRNGDFIFVVDHYLVDGRRDFRALRNSCRLGGHGEPWITALAGRVGALARGVAAPGRRIGFLAVPTKPVLYWDRLPPSVPPELRRACRRSAERQPWAAALHDLARAEGFAFDYPLERLAKHRDEADFYPPGNFHTEGMSAHLATWSLLAQLYPGEYRPGAPGYRTRTGTADMKDFLLYSREIVFRQPRYGRRDAHRDADAEAALIARHPDIPRLQVYRRVPAAIGGDHSGPPRRGLVIGNSFAVHTVADLAPGFTETILLPTNFMAPATAQRLFAEIIPALAPDAIVFVFHDAGFKRERNAIERLADALRAVQAEAEAEAPVVQP